MKRHRHGRDQRRPHPAQEHEHDQDNQSDGDRERLLDLVERRADRRGPLERHLEVGGGGDRRAQPRHQVLDPLHGFEDVGVRLLVDLEQHRRPAVPRPGVAHVLH
jgi:hypothetical protein